MRVRGVDHVSINVKDMGASEAFYGGVMGFLRREKGVKIVLLTTDIASWGARVLLFLDPNGVTLEFCQELK